MCGGEKDNFETVKSLMQNYGKTINLMGGPGKGQHAKMVAICPLTKGEPNRDSLDNGGGLRRADLRVQVRPGSVTAC
jgi:hypothetical protein